MATRAVAIVPTVGGRGYWVVMGDGSVFSFGDADSSIFDNYAPAAGHYVIGAARTADGHGLWILQSDGGVFSLGDANFYGRTGGMQLNQPIVGMAQQMMEADTGSWHPMARFFHSATQDFMGRQAGCI